MATDYNAKARRLRNAVEPAAARAYFAPTAHWPYQALGFDPSPAGSYIKPLKGVNHVADWPHFGSGLTLDAAAQLHRQKV